MEATGAKGNAGTAWLAPAWDDYQQGEGMNRYLRNAGLAVIAATGLCALSGCASVGREAGLGVPMEERPATVGVGVGDAALKSEAWPETVPLLKGVEILGMQCANRHCYLWSDTVDYRQMMTLRQEYMDLIGSSGKWELLGMNHGLYDSRVYRYTGTMPSDAGSCGYTVEMRHFIPSGHYDRFRLHLTVTW